MNDQEKEYKSDESKFSLKIKKDNPDYKWLIEQGMKLKLADVKELIEKLKDNVRGYWMKNIEDSRARFYLGVVERDIKELLSSLDNKEVKE